ncbi:T9SS type A sorting domain-containing protein [Fulvivirgaceae bacterium PWU4]|uniref:T9SS type A sorting domain-containing protein n=1 Tax=Chryseosolibacter histidini TaxID=2782349 RepID=A0AAP2DIQ4_9BACT|nr:T9SS type A sorting domain-containing protein [Chryseosolibacter histidini]MBT1695942.1 T9SS type A sorting domain-containing protein [Chryseosolibacter histidini]
MIKQYGVSKRLSMARFTQVVLCVLALHANVCAQQLQWFNYQDNYPRNMATDAQGNVYVTGTDEYDNNNQNMNVFVRKYTASGTLVWERKSTTPFCCSFSDSRGIAVDAQGNVYIAGNFQSRIQFDTTLLESSYSDIFLAKYSSAGTLLWATSLYSSTEFEGDEFVSDLNIDLQNNPVLIGTFQKEMRMDSTAIFPAADAPVSGMSSYILKASARGSWLSLERLDIHLAYSLEIDASGDYVVGGTHKSHVMPHYYTDPETGESDTSYIEMYDIALAKYASGGSLLWNHRYGSADLQDHLYEMKIDSAGNAYVTGYDVPPLGPAATERVVFTKINSSGTLQWTKAYQISGYTPGDSFICTEVAVDKDPHPVFGGQFKGTILLEGQAFTSVSSRDMIIARYDQNGNMISAFTASGTGDDVLSDMVVGSDNSLYLTGFTYPYSSARMGSVAAATTPLHFISKYALMTTPVQTVLGYTLIDAANGQPISELEEGDTISLATLHGKKINIRVNTDPPVVGSVMMMLNGKARTDNTAPYSVKGDLDGAYLPWTPAPRKYTLASTAYSAANAGGEEGGSRTITFYVAARPKPMPATIPLSEKFTMYPNPVLSDLTISVTRPLEKNIGIQIVDFSGQVRHQAELRAGESSKNIDLSKLPKGVYLLKMASGAERCTRRIIKE